MQCHSQCHAQPLCCSFDFDAMTNRCRLFVFGKIIPSSSSSSQVGTIQYTSDLYIQYNQACTSNNSDISRYLTCGINNKYQCLSGFWWNGIMCTRNYSKFDFFFLFFDCLAMYWASGPQMNLNSSILRGWSLCYNDTYDVQLNGLPLTNILNQCNQSKLLMACGSIYTPNIYSVAAVGLRQDVVSVGAYDLAHTHAANGLQWYFSTNISWGFASDTDSISGSWCDTDVTNPSHRLCWHTVPGYDGYRCGSTIFNLTVNPSLWQRVMWYAN
jgi:hypothetical protein